jgi:sRNA-binding carbon storage regulator CsrA
LLKLELRVGESVRIGDAVVTLEDKSGRIARLAIKADKSVPIQRVQETMATHLAKNGIGAMPAMA